MALANIAVGVRCLMLLLPTVLHAQEADRDRPNIVFIFSDDHATQALGAYEGCFAGLDPTPHIDRLPAPTSR